MFSLDELRSAWERVRDNDGCAGVDGIATHHFAAQAEKRLERLRDAVAGGRYRPLPLLEILVQKSADSPKLRRLLVPAVCDRVLQTAAARLVSPAFEDEFLDTSFAYRPGRGVDSAVARVLQLRDRGFQWVVDADIASYFDEVDHILLQSLLAAEPMEEWLRELIGQWIAAETWDGRRVRPMRKGIPQGSPLSPSLANLFLHDLDALLSQGDCHMVRYADDFLVLCPGEPEALEAMRRAGEWLTSRKLRFQPDVRRTAPMRRGLKLFQLRRRRS